MKPATSPALSQPAPALSVLAAASLSSRRCVSLAQAALASGTTLLSPRNVSNSALHRAGESTIRPGVACACQCRLS